MARKKLQKLFALLLTFSLSMSLLSVGAFAAEGDDDGKIQLSSVYLPDTEKRAQFLLAHLRNLFSCRATCLES